MGAKTLRDLDRGIDQMRWSMRNYRDRIEQHMKAHAPWKDQTGWARDHLRARLEETPLPGGGLHMRLILDYGDSGDVDYDVFLETMQSGRFAIVGPSADLFGPRIQRRLRELSRGTGIGVTAAAQGWAD